MIRFLCLLIALSAPIACSTPAQLNNPNSPLTQHPQPNSNLTAEQKKRIGQRIWQNESAGTVEGLTAWNAGENFASLGIGHMIWYPAGIPPKFEESFPSFVALCQSRNIPTPNWITPQTKCPWPDRRTFEAQSQSAQMRELRQWLVDTIPTQTDFLISRQRAALPKMLAEAPANQRTTINTRFQNLAATEAGTFALIDYVNFKGEGINPAERYNNQGWGLLQVLQNMQGTPEGDAAVREFATSAERTLQQRVRNAPPERNEQRWMPGWSNRVNRY